MADGRQVGFGKLLLATGAEARTLAVTSERACTLRHMADAEKLETLMQNARSITAIGAGLVSLPLLSHAPESAEKHLVVGSNRIFSRVVDAEASAILEEMFRKCGLQLHKHDDIVAIDEGDRLQLTLASGGRLDSDMLIVGKGVTPNTDLARSGRPSGARRHPGRRLLPHQPRRYLCRRRCRGRARISSPANRPSRGTG